MTDHHRNLRRIARVLHYTQAIAFAGVCVAGAVLWQQAAEFQNADLWVEHSHDVITAIDEVRTDTLRAGMWLRTLAISPSDRAASEVRSACAMGLQASERLQALTLDNASQAARAGVVAAEVRKTAGWMQNAADIEALSGTKVLARVLGMRIDRDSTRALKMELDDMRTEEQRLLHDRFQQQGQQLGWIKRLAALFGFALLAFLAWSLGYSNRLMRSSHKQIARFAEVSFQDPLTGLLNRRALLQQVGGLSAERQFAVIAFDLDDFKPINDTYGHGVGDDVLRMVAMRLGEQCRDQDIAARVGGDEFVVVLADIKEPSLAELIVTRIRLALTEPIEFEDFEVRVGASLGVAIRGVDGNSFEDLLKEADARSYQSKRRAKAAMDDDLPCTGRSADGKPRLSLVA